MPEGSPKRILSWSPQINYFTLVTRVAQKYSLNSNTFRLFYKHPQSDDIFELGDDEDMEMLKYVYQNTSQTVTIFVVKSGGDGDHRSSSSNNQPGGSSCPK